jgi:hypothetical protein
MTKEHSTAQAVKRPMGLTEAAHTLGLSYQSAHRLVLLGFLRGHKRGGRWLVDSVDVRRLGRTGRATARKTHAPRRSAHGTRRS